VLELGVPRVMGHLAVSRALGDAELKKYVIPDPETLVIARTDSKQADDSQTFVLLATDGLWDVMSSDEAVAFIYSRWEQDDHGESNACLSGLHCMYCLHACLLLLYLHRVWSNIQNRLNDMFPLPLNLGTAQALRNWQGRHSIGVRMTTSAAWLLT